VNIEIDETSADPVFDAGYVTAVADEYGSISNADFLVEQSFLGQGFSATATGASSGAIATTTFIDLKYSTLHLPGGAAPVNPPNNGFAMDGDLQSNTNSVAGIVTTNGDWIPGLTNGPGGNVMGTNGVPVDPTFTFHLTDVANAGNTDNIFGSGGQLDDNPATW